MCNSCPSPLPHESAPVPKSPCPVNLRPGREWTRDEWEQIRIWLRDGLEECIETKKVYFCECGEMKPTADPFASCKFCGYEHQGFECEGCDQLVDPEKWWEHSEEICSMRYQNVRADRLIGPKNNYMPYAPALIELAVERNRLRYIPGTQRYKEALAEQVADARATKRLRENINEDIRKVG